MMDKAVVIQIVLLLTASSTGLGFSQDKPNIGRPNDIELIVIVYHTSVSLCAVYIITDDQDIKLGSLDVQPQVRSLLTEKGMFFKNAFVTTPVCCPSR